VVPVRAFAGDEKSEVEFGGWEGEQG
jgi:hypothetical protein